VSARACRTAIALLRTAKGGSSQQNKKAVGLDAKDAKVD
jgi:hypothetical protein